MGIKRTVKEEYIETIQIIETEWERLKEIFIEASEKKHATGKAVKEVKGKTLVNR